MSKYNIGLTLLVIATFLDLSFNIARASFPPHKVEEKTHLITPTPTHIPLSPKKLVTTNSTRSTMVLDADTETIYDNTRHGDIITRLYTLESSRGENNAPICAKQGLRNDFGFDLSDGTCFATLKDEVIAIDHWIDKHSNLSLVSMLCMWQTGSKSYSSGCSEVNKFMSLTITN